MTHENGLPRRNLFVICNGVDGQCEELALDASGCSVKLSQVTANPSYSPNPSHHRQVALHPLLRCQRHGGGRRCSAAGCSHAQGGWARRHQQLKGMAAGTDRGLCSACGEEAGLKAVRAEASLEACACFDMIERSMGVHVEHMHWEVGSGRWVGEEERGLVAPRRDRPDGVVRDAVGHVSIVYFYHGVHVHGYPPEHPLHGSMLSLTGRSAAEAYARTMESMQRFANAGYSVRYVWSCEFEPFVRASQRRPATEMCEIVHVL